MAKRREPLVPSRLRRPPNEGFSWIDRRFLREYAVYLSRDGVLLYFFLAAVSDKLGLSFYGDRKVAAILRLDEEALNQARGELLYRDLIAYQAPYTQVLSLPAARCSRSGSEPPRHLGELLRNLLPPRS